MASRSPFSPPAPLCPACKVELPLEPLRGEWRCDACHQVTRSGPRAREGLPRWAFLALGVTVTAGLALAAVRLAPGAIVRLSTWPGSSSVDDLPPAPPAPPPPAPPPPPDNGITSGAYWTDRFPLTGPWLGEQNEDLLGLMHDSDVHTTSLVAIDGESFRIAWSVRGSGGSIRFATVGGRVVWTVGDGKAHVLDVRTGGALREIALDDQTQALCPHPASPGRVLHVGANGTRAALDLESGAAARDTGSAACPDLSKDNLRLATPAGERALLPRMPDGIQARLGLDSRLSVLFDGSIGVLYAVKYPGFPVPVLVGFDRKSRRVLWSTLLAEPSGNPPQVVTFDVSNGQAVALLHGSKPRIALAAIETATGKLSWTTEVPCESSALRITPSRAYVRGRTQLYVFDRKTGRHLRSIGREVKPLCH